MCIPIELDVPVVTRDDEELGIAREILCPCPGDIVAGSAALPGGLDATYAPTDLWLRVTRPARSDLYIPFGEIAETRPDGVRLRLASADIESRHWQRLPAGLPVPA
jgi:hypothetical protein